MAMANEPKVVIKSIEFAKRIITKLDSDSGQDNLEFVLGQLSPNNVIYKPKAVLDALLAYLFLVHGVDWYAEVWEVKIGGLGQPMTARPDSISVSSNSRQAEVEAYLARLQYKTELFLQVF
jgi:hypothetical protein